MSPSRVLILRPAADVLLAIGQATEGDVQGSRPGMFSLEARAKYDAWAKLKGMSKEDAMKGYVEAMGDPSEWEHNPALAQYAPG